MLRTVAVTMVIFGHLGQFPDGSVLRPLGDWFRSYGGLGVDLFFVLSGFLVSGLLFTEYLRSGHANVPRFLIRRGFKIYPAFYFFIAVTVWLRIRFGDSVSARQVLSELLFVQNYGAHVWSHTWSLAVEEHFYLLLAFIVFALCRWLPRAPLSRIPLIFWGTTALVCIARAITIAAVPYSTPTHRFPTHLNIDSLFTGVLAAYYYYTDKRMAEVARRYAPVIAIGAVTCLLVAQSLPTFTAVFIAGHLLTNLGFVGIVILAAVLPSPVDRVSRSVAWIGAQSYSIYLWHAAVMGFGSVIMPRLAGRPLSEYVTMAWYVPGSFVVGIVMAKSVEMPTLRLRDRLFAADRNVALGSTGGAAAHRGSIGPAAV